MLVLGHDEAGFSPHPENFIRMAPWTGDASDHRLEESIDFLEMLAFSRLADVRPLAKQYAGLPFPESFDRAQERAFDAARDERTRSLQGRLASLFSFGKGSRGVTGVASSTATSDSIVAKDGDSHGDVITTYLVKKQERLELRRKEYGRIKELMQAQLQAELQKEKDYYAEHKMSVWDLFAKGPPPPPPNK